MGYHTYAEVCPNVAHLGVFNDLLNVSKFEEDPNLTDAEFAELEENGIQKLPHHWKKIAGSSQVGVLFPDLFQKTLKYKSGKTKVLDVFLLNTDEYAHVGGEDWVVFSDNKKAVGRFLKDFGIVTNIKPTSAVTQTQ